MKISIAAFTASLSFVVSEPEDLNPAPYGEVPPGLADGGQEAWAAFVEAAFPTWCIDENETRQTEKETCDDGTINGRYDPLYLTKWHSGEDPSLGGYPTNLDTRYPFEFASGFFGQSGAGSPHHCPFDFDNANANPKTCPKVIVDNDIGPDGPGHIPPHISLAALTRAYHEGTFGDVEDWFDVEQHGCRVLPTVLLSMIRKYFPRDPVDGSASYPPPFTDLGGPSFANMTNYPYPLEFVNLVGDSCDAEKAKRPGAFVDCYETHSPNMGPGSENDFPDYLDAGHGSPHFCTQDGKDADVSNDWCPYIFFGPNRGKYRHPHIAFSALEVFLANQAGVEGCGTTWDDNDGKYFPATPDTSAAFPKMEEVDGHPDDPEQPKLNKCGFIWPGDDGDKRKAVPGVFNIELYLMGSAPSSPSNGSCPSFGLRWEFRYSLLLMVVSTRFAFK